MDKTLTIITEQQAEQHLLTLSGRLDTLGARVLDETIQNLSGIPEQHILLDMQELTFLSSAGIRILIKYYKQCRENGGEFTMIHVPQQANSVLKMVGLEQLVLTGEKEDVHANSEFEYDHIKFTCQILHEETANLIQYKASGQESVMFHPYDLAVGRDVTQHEFIACNTRIISDTQQSDQMFTLDYYIGTHGSPSHFVTFTPLQEPSVSLSVLLHHFFEICNATCAGLLLHADSAGLTGIRFTDGQALLTRCPSYKGQAVWVTGIISRKDDPQLQPYLRPIQNDNQLSGHLHAAVYPFPGTGLENTDPAHFLQSIPTHIPSQALLHLVQDQRTTSGSGETHLSKGYAWIIKIK